MLEDDEDAEFETRLIKRGFREHDSDGAGTRATNPLYVGDYTINDYYTDNVTVKDRTSDRFTIMWEYDIDLTHSLEGFDCDEWKRFDKARSEAMKRYTGQREWPHGYTLEMMCEIHDITIWRYFECYYELSDVELDEAMDELLAEYAKRAAELSLYHEDFLKALQNNTDWPGKVRELNEIYRIFNIDARDKSEFFPELPEDAEKLASYFVNQLRCMSAYWDTPKAVFKRVPNPSHYIETYFDEHIEELKPYAEATVLVKNLGANFDPLKEYIEKLDVYDCWTTWEIIKRLDCGDEPPTEITPEIQKNITSICEKVIQEWEENLPLYERAWQPLEKSIRDVNLTKGRPDTIPVPHNAFTDDIRKKTIAWASEIRETRSEFFELESIKNRELDERLRGRISLGNHDAPTLAEWGFIEQLASERESRMKEGEVLKLSDVQLFKRRYGLSDNASINDKTRAKFRSRFKEFSEIRVLADAKIDIDDRNDTADYLESVGCKEKRLIDPEIEICLADDRKSLIEVYTFDKPILIHEINKWFGNRFDVNWNLIQTESIPADELKPVSKRHYESENLRGDKRKRDALYLDPIAHADTKYCILYTLIRESAFIQRGQPNIRLNLEEVYTTRYGEPAPSKTKKKWKDFVKTVYTYLTFLIEKGGITDYRKGKDSGTVYVSIAEGNRLYPSKQPEKN